jgi:hypothetical protein
MGRISVMWTTLREAAGPHWLRTVSIVGLAIYGAASAAESFLQGRGMTFAHTLNSAYFVIGAGIVLVFWWLLSYAMKLRVATTPRFSVSFNQEKSGVVLAIEKIMPPERMFAPPEELKRMKPTHEYRAHYLRIFVAATSKATVKNCRAFIVSLEKQLMPDTAFLIINLPQAIPLTENSFDVLPNIPCHVDFMKASEQDNRFCRTGYWPYVLERVFDEEGTYRFTFAVNGDGVTADHLQVEVVWRGKWDLITAHQLFLNSEA